MRFELRPAFALDRYSATTRNLLRAPQGRSTSTSEHRYPSGTARPAREAGAPERLKRRAIRQSGKRVWHGPVPVPPLVRPAPGRFLMSTTRLSALDASFLDIETPTAYMHVGWATTFTQPESGPRRGYDDFFPHIAGRLLRSRRYFQKLAPVPLGVYQPQWVDDEDFDPGRH